MVVAIAPALPATALPAAAAPVLALRTDPLELRGSRFFPRERVRVVVTIDEVRLVRSIETSAKGTFALRVRAKRPLTCSTVVGAVATGARGDRAVLKRPPRECPPPARADD